jgi:hypothetical protein
MDRDFPFWQRVLIEAASTTLACVPLYFLFRALGWALVPGWPFN